MIVVDRTLHMLSPVERVDVLQNLLRLTMPGTSTLFADERSNVPAFSTVFDESRWDWTTTLARKGFLFMLRR